MDSDISYEIGTRGAEGDAWTIDASGFLSLESAQEQVAYFRRLGSQSQWAIFRVERTLADTVG